VVSISQTSAAERDTTIHAFSAVLAPFADRPISNISQSISSHHFPSLPQSTPHPSLHLCSLHHSNINTATYSTSQKMTTLSRALPRAVSLSKSTSTTTITRRTLTSTRAHRSADHGDHYDPPSGWLWGVKPGEKAEKEGWENIWVYGFLGTCAFGVVGYAVKPDTS
jgi:hypothetical protein